eukprot:CAMPEP_0176159698 /NCGR_PEP_ID=MMETSP0120_2-20121206/81698_1 /TAXON_ID=160619 /ORGANISM="Kryptoperidinium foliaceum, Strain CCMP 1326" /LENGTH=157 /DNA_ID=CAMNT_0017497129 /DNA_START=136 /DNA_END=609 /DNA_ORIENTATION=+
MLDHSKTTHFFRVGAPKGSVNSFYLKTLTILIVIMQVSDPSSSGGDSPHDPSQGSSNAVEHHQDRTGSYRDHGREAGDCASSNGDGGRGNADFTRPSSDDDESSPTISERIDQLPPCFLDPASLSTSLRRPVAPSKSLIDILDVTMAIVEDSSALML